MTGPMIIEKKVSLYDEMKTSDSCTFSEGQVQNFKECHGIRKLDRSSDVLSVDAEAAEWYSELFQNLMEQHKFLQTKIYNT